MKEDEIGIQVFCEQHPFAEEIVTIARASGPVQVKICVVDRALLAVTVEPTLAPDSNYIWTHVPHVTMYGDRRQKVALVGEIVNVKKHWFGVTTTHLERRRESVLETIRRVRKNTGEYPYHIISYYPRSETSPAIVALHMPPNGTSMEKHVASLLCEDRRNVHWPVPAAMVPKEKTCGNKQCGVPLSALASYCHRCGTKYQAT